jgi:cytochrome o ubiquinol oxidase subunit 2
MKRDLILPGIAVFLVLGIVAYAVLHSAQLPVFSPAGIVALQERSIIILTVLLSSIVIIPVFGLLAYFGWKYRASNTHADEHHEPNWDHDNALAEFFWWTVPTVIIVFLGVLAWRSSTVLDPYRPLVGEHPPMTIEVVALDWKWLFIYPAQKIATVNFVEIPENTPVDFVITSKGPMNSFWIPSLGGQIMAMPMMTTHLNLLASKTGTFAGSSANISGRGFASMTFTAKSVTTDDFQSWVQGAQQQSPLLSADVYSSLIRPSTNVPVMTYTTDTMPGMTMP